MEQQSLSGNDIAAALNWWREAGVDCDFHDDPQNWLPQEEVAPQVAEPAREPEPVLVKLGGDRAAWPGDLAGFQQWWQTEPTLDAGRTSGRVAPRGPIGAPVLVLVAYPEAEDREQLLTGPQGNLIAAMLRAMGIKEEQAYLASVLPRHTPHPDWPALQAQGIGEILQHHLQLAAPQRVIVFGKNILPLLGHDPANSGNILLNFNHEGPSLPVLAAMELGVLLGSPRRKAGFWQQWLEWTG